MGSMVALNIGSGSVITELMGSMMSTSNHEVEVLVSRVYAEKIHHLFNYGMNACHDQALVKNCILELFSFIVNRPDIVQKGGVVDSEIFKIFRRLLLQQLAVLKEMSKSVTQENFFSVEPKMSQGLTNLQREALFLKFQRTLTYREMANVMDITIEQLRSQISKAVDLLLHRNVKDLLSLVDESRS